MQKTGSAEECETCWIGKCQETAENQGKDAMERK